MRRLPHRRPRKPPGWLHAVVTPAPSPEWETTTAGVEPMRMGTFSIRTSCPVSETMHACTGRYHAEPKQTAKPKRGKRQWGWVMVHPRRRARASSCPRPSPHQCRTLCVSVTGLWALALVIVMNGGRRGRAARCVLPESQRPCPPLPEKGPAVPTQNQARAQRGSAGRGTLAERTRGMKY